MTVAADPQADPERRLAPAGIAGRDTLAAKHLARADQRRRALELLRRQQAQRVAHQHADAVAAVVAADHALQPADRQRERGEPEVRLGLAAAGREEQQVDEPRVPGFAPDGVGSASDGRFSSTNASWNGRHERCAGTSAAASRSAKGVSAAATPRRRRERVHALLPHRVVGEAERLRGRLVGSQSVDAGMQPLGDICVRAEAIPGLSPPAHPDAHRDRRYARSCRSSQPSYAAASGRRTSTS